MITFKKFKETVLDKMTERYKGKYKVYLIDVPKNTGGTEVGLNITKENIEDGIVFRLEDYYKYLVQLGIIRETKEYCRNLKKIGL